MEKTLNVNKIISFIEKAMEENCIIQELKYNEGCELCIHKHDCYNEYVSIIFNSDLKNRYISIFCNHSYYKLDNVTEDDILRLNLLNLKVRDYIQEGLEKCFNNFFKEEKESITDINDLDNDND